MGKYTGSVATSQRQQIAFDDALAESDRKKVEMQDFEYTERKKFESKAGGDVREASMFAKWLFKNTGKSIKNATKEDLQNYIDTGNKGNPFGQTLKQNSQKVGNVMRWVKELKSLSKYIQVFIK